MLKSWQSRSFALVALFSSYRLLVMGLTGLGDAEAYYWRWSRSIDLSYFDHPPVVAYLIRIFNEIGGESVFWTRFPSLLFFVLSCILIHKIALLIFEDEEIAFYSLLFFILCPILAFGGLQIVPDIPAMFFWFLFVYLVVLLLKEDRPALWYPVGFVSGLGLLSKYLVLPVIPATLLMLFVHKEHRKHLKAPHIYLGGVLGLIAFSPVLVWNYLNDFPSFRFHLMQRNTGTHFEPRHMAEALAGQALYYSPLMWVALLYTCYLMGKKLFIEKDKRYMELFWYSVPPLIFFLLITFWTKESEPHWTAFGYLTVFIAWASLFKEGKKFFKRFTVASLILAFSMIAIFYTQVFIPFLPLKPKYDLTNGLYGWEVAGPKIEELYAKLPNDKPKFVMSHNHILSGPIAFAVKNRLPVFSLNQKIDQFDFFDPPTPDKGANFIYVTDNLFNRKPGDYYKFDRVEKPIEIIIKRHGKYARTFYLYVGYGYQGLR